MAYTCAYYQGDQATLEQAQTAKMDHVCRKLRLGAADSLVEAGCGWGSLALHMASRYGAKVRAFNISREQLEFARWRAREQGLEHGSSLSRTITVILADLTMRSHRSGCSNTSAASIFPNSAALCETR
jgi:cyclopropane fatty-acyl-phospholipid synthase-like methyltransferase